MKKRLASRIIGLIVIYCLVFCVIVILQFSNMGSFSLNAGAMNIRGRYLQTKEPVPEGLLPITGGIKIYYGGLEFNLGVERGRGMTITGYAGSFPVNPEYMIILENSVRFILPDETVITFNSIDSAGGPELQINAEFAEASSELIIPVIPRRSSLIIENDQLGIMYGGLRYLFPGQELEENRITLTRENTFISYRSRGRQRTFDPEDFIIADINNYDTLFRNWRDMSYINWSQNTASLQNEDDILAYTTEALQRGNFAAAAAAIPASFINSTRQSYRSSVLAGGMAVGYRSLIASESEMISLITRLTRERSLSLLNESHILNYLFTRNNVSLANEVINIITTADPAILTIDYCAGLFEVFIDAGRWRPGINVIEHLIEPALLLISENINRDIENDIIYITTSEGITADYSARLGKALINWAQITQNPEWEGIGKSLVLSAIATGNPGRLHNILTPVNYPRAELLTDTLWAWTSAQSINASYIGGNLNLAVTFPVNSAHYVILRGIQPFLRIQIHTQDWRSDPNFERYDSSGWVYYPQDQILILKLRHRTSIENVRIYYVEEAPPPPPPAPTPVPEPEVETPPPAETTVVEPFSWNY